MDYHVVEARYVTGYTVWLRFRDGTTGEIDLASVLEGPVFEPLRDPEVFRQFRIHPEFHTLVWANGADIAPEFLHDNVRITARRRLGMLARQARRTRVKQRQADEAAGPD